MDCARRPIACREWPCTAAIRPLALLAATALLFVGTPAAALDLSKPEDAHLAMLRIVGDLDGKPVFKDWDVTILAVLPNEKPRPILRMQGYNAGRLIARPDGAHEWVTREVSYYQDVTTLRWDIPLAYPNVLQPAEHPEESSGPTYLASEHFTFFANTADVLSDTQRSTATHYCGFAPVRGCLG